MSSSPEDTVRNASDQVQSSGGYRGHKHFTSYEDLPFQYLALLGRGATSVVHRVQVMTNGTVVARKSFHVRARMLQQAKQKFEKEINIMRRLVHPHIVRILGTYSTSHELGIILQPVAEINLANYLLNITDDGALATSEQATLLRQSFGCLASALTYLHHNSIRHGDIKPSNILIHQSNVLFSNFGCSTDYREAESSTMTGSERFTPRYAAPEVGFSRPVGMKSDIFSLGCVFMEILGVLTPMETLRDLRSAPYHKALDKIRDFLNHSKPANADYGKLFSLVLNMLEAEPHHRPDANDLVREKVT